MHSLRHTHTHGFQTLHCSWQMRELSHLLTCGGVEERPSRGALSTSLSRRWIAHAVAIYHRGRGGRWLVAQSPSYPLNSKSELTHQSSSRPPSGPPARAGKSLDRLLGLKRRTDEAIEGKDDKNPTDKLWCFTSLYFLLQKDSRPHNNKFYQLLYMRFRGYCYKLKTIYNQSPWTSFQ